MCNMKATSSSDQYHFFLNKIKSNVKVRKFNYYQQKDLLIRNIHVGQTPTSRSQSKICWYPQKDVSGKVEILI